MHFCVSFISVWWFIWRFCYIIMLYCFQQIYLYQAFRFRKINNLFVVSARSVKFILFCKYSCIPLTPIYNYRQYINWGIFHIQCARIVSLACYHLIYGTDVLAKITVVSSWKKKLYIELHSYFIKFSTVVSQGGEIKLLKSL